MTQALETEDHGRYSDGQMCGKHLWKGTFVSWLCDDGFCKNVHRGEVGFLQERKLPEWEQSLAHPSSG